MRTSSQVIKPGGAEVTGRLAPRLLVVRLDGLPIYGVAVTAEHMHVRIYRS